MAMVDAHEDRDIMTTNVPNAFIQTDMISKHNDQHIIMKITGVLVDTLVKKIHNSTAAMWSMRRVKRLFVFAYSRLFT